MRDLDLAIFYAINNWPEGLSPVMIFISECTKIPAVRVFLLVLVIFLVWRKATRLPIILTMIAWPLANEATDILKAGFRGLRPCVELPDAIVRVNMLTSFGTASAHSANMAAVAAATWLTFGRKVGIPVTIIAFLTGLSRIYVGVHYPYQVLLGWSVGFLIALAVVKGAQLIQRKYFPASLEEPLGASTDQDAQGSPSELPQL